MADEEFPVPVILEQPVVEAFEFYVETSANVHQGGVNQPSVDLLERVKDTLRQTAADILAAEQAEDPSVTLVSWGWYSTLTGEHVAEFTTLEDAPATPPAEVPPADAPDAT